MRSPVLTKFVAADVALEFCRLIFTFNAIQLCFPHTLFHLIYQIAVYSMMINTFLDGYTCIYPAHLVQHGELAGGLVDGGLHVHVGDAALALQARQLVEVRREQRRRPDHLCRQWTDQR